MLKRSIIGLIVVLSLSGCSTGLSVSYGDRQFQQFDFKDSMGYVYFYRPPTIFGALRTLDVYEEKTLLGSLNSGTYIIVETEPGEHHYLAMDNIRSKEKILTLDVEAGQRYYIKATLDTDVIDYKPVLRLKVDDKDFKRRRVHRVPLASDQ